MNPFKLALGRFARGLIVGFVVINLLLLAVLLPTVGTSAVTLVYASSIAGLLAVVVAFREALDPTAPANPDVSLGYAEWKRCYSTWEMFWKTCLLSTVGTFCLNVVGWYVYWMISFDAPIANVVANLRPITVFSLVVGIFFGCYDATKYWWARR